MVDQELLQAIGQMLDKKLSPLQQAQAETREDIRELKEAQARVEARLDHVDVRLDKIDARLDSIEARLDAAEGRLGTVETGLAKAEAKAAQLETKVDGVRVLLDVEIQRTLNLLLEGQQTLTDQMPDPRKYQILETRVSALELAVKHHSWEIQELQHA